MRNVMTFIGVLLCLVIIDFAATAIGAQSVGTILDAFKSNQTTESNNFSSSIKVNVSNGQMSVTSSGIDFNEISNAVNDGFTNIQNQFTPFVSAIPGMRIVISSVFGSNGSNSTIRIGDQTITNQSGATSIVIRNGQITINGVPVQNNAANNTAAANVNTNNNAQTNTNANANKNANTNTTPQTPAKTPTDNSISGLRSFIKTEYGVDAIDGSSQWTAAQLKDLATLLAKLPAEFRDTVKTIKRDRRGNTGDFGSTTWGGSEAGTIRMYDLSATLEGRFQRVLTHEMTHAYQQKYPEKLAAWEKAFYVNGRGNPPYSLNPSYPASATDPKEDMAESVRDYVFNKLFNGELKARHPERYAFIKKNIMNGLEF